VSSGPEHEYEITSPGRPRTVEVADGVYAYVQPDGTWWINNTGFLVGPRGVISIDTCSTERRTRAYLAAIAFGPARELPFWQNPDWGELPLEPPFLTFTDEIALHSGDTRVTVRHIGTAAHTTNDVVAWIPDQSVLFCGDLVFNGGTPLTCLA
jgi:cyclase